MEPEAYNSRVWHNKGNKASYTNPQGIYTASSDEQSLFSRQTSVGKNAKQGRVRASRSLACERRGSETLVASKSKAVPTSRIHSQARTLCCFALAEIFRGNERLLAVCGNLSQITNELLTAVNTVPER